MNTVIIGAQWGDEGKGKIVDLLALKNDIVVRFQGGNNAGHTVVVHDKTYKLHLIPSGILYPGKICILGNGVVIAPDALLQEMEEISKSGHSMDRLYISERANVIMPYHKAMDALEEKIKGDSKIGTTGRGIGPSYSDKVARCGIRIVDLLDGNILRKKLSSIFKAKEKIFQAWDEKWPFSLDTMVEQYMAYGKLLSPHITDTSLLLWKFIKSGKSVLFEGAQGTFLDIDYGSYPFVTSSNTIAGNACAGSGVGPTQIHKVLGVAKAYTTRVGEGVFPTELKDSLGDKLRGLGKEFGTTTGRPRRCGWLDLAMLKTAARLNGIHEFCLTKLDVLSGLSSLKVCTGYKYEGKELEGIPASDEIYQKIEPVYEVFPGWNEDISACHTFSELPAPCQEYVKKIEEFLEVPISLVSVGPERNQTIAR